MDDIEIFNKYLSEIDILSDEHEKVYDWIKILSEEGYKNNDYANEILSNLGGLKIRGKGSTSKNYVEIYFNPVYYAGGEIAELESAEVGTELGGIGTNGIIDGKTPAGRFADKVQGLPNSERPNTVAVVRTSDGRYYIGYNKAGVNNGEVQAIMDSLGNSNMYNRQCAEVNAISRAINKGANLEVATISVANVRSVGNYSGLHGTPKKPGDVCQPLLDFYGIKILQ